MTAGQEARFEHIATELYRATHDHEVGVRRYEYWRGAAPRTYYALLAFDDFRSFLTHQTSAHHEAASPDLGAVIEAMRLEWVDPISEASPLPATCGQSIAADADALTQQYAERFAAQVAAWWLALRPESAHGA